MSGKNSGPKPTGKIRKEQLDNRRPEETKLIPQLLIIGLSVQLKTAFRKDEYWWEDMIGNETYCPDDFDPQNPNVFQLYRLNFTDKPLTVHITLFRIVMPIKAGWKVSENEL